MVEALAQADLVELGRYGFGPSLFEGVAQVRVLAVAEQQLARARAAIDLPAFVVPLVVREQWDRGAVEAVADALERSP